MLVHSAPGHVLHEAVSVRNLTSQPISVRLQPAEIENASNGNAAYVTTPLKGVGRWVHLSTKSVSLAGHAAKRVAFTVDIPAGATGASHYAGIVGINAADLTTAVVSRARKGGTFAFHRINRQALPLTVRLPGPLSRSLALRSMKLSVQPAGAAIVLGLLPRGSELIEGAQIKLRVLRGAHTVFTYSGALGQLFPNDRLDYRVAWKGRPTTGAYRVEGVIRPQGAATIDVRRTITFTAAKVNQLTHQTPPAATPAPAGIAGWVWIALGIAAALLLLLSGTVYKLARRSAKPAA